jgi:hypothetical protein
MHKGVKDWVLVIALAIFFAEPSWATEDVALAKDLTVVITLLGMPCTEVVSIQRQGESDNIATCKTGDRYRVHVNAEGRVVAEKQE